MKAANEAIVDVKIAVTYMGWQDQRAERESRCQGLETVDARFDALNANSMRMPRQSTQGLTRRTQSSTRMPRQSTQGLTR